MCTVEDTSGSKCMDRSGNRPDQLRYSAADTLPPCDPGFVGSRPALRYEPSTRPAIVPPRAQLTSSDDVETIPLLRSATSRTRRGLRWSYYEKQGQPERRVGNLRRRSAARARWHGATHSRFPLNPYVRTPGAKLECKPTSSSLDRLSCPLHG